MTVYQQTKFCCKKQKPSVQKIQFKHSYCDYISPYCDLDLEDRSQFFCMTHQLRTMHCHIRFGYKRLSCSEDIFWTKPGRQLHKETDTRTQRFQYITHHTPHPAPLHFYKTWTRSKTKLHIFRKCYKKKNKVWKVLWKSSEHCADIIFYCILSDMLNILGYRTK